MINWDEIRKRFPVTENYAYLNSAAAGPLSVATRAAATAYYDLMTADGDAQWENWLTQREEVRRKVAALINAEPDEIALTTNTSSGMNVIVDALESSGEVISCDLEFPVSTLPWMNRRIPVHLIESKNGRVEIGDLCAAMSAETGIISISHVQFSNGLRTDLEALGNAKGNHTLVVNASQSAGAFEIDVKRMKIDALCATGHKWMLGGYGSGFVYLSRELLARSKAHGMGWLSVTDPYAMKNNEMHLRHDAAARVELGCPHFAGMFAIGASIDLMLEIGVKEIEERVLGLNRLLTERLKDAGWEVLSPLNQNMRSAQTLVAVDEPGATVAKLAARKVVVTEKPQGIRVATHFFNNEDDIDQLLAALGGTR